MAVVAKRFDVYLINLDPTVGSEIKKTRPCLIITPDEMNRYINTVIVAPMTRRGKLTRPGQRVSFRARSARSCWIKSERSTKSAW
jgi:mRNA interferase MazF